MTTIQLNDILNWREEHLASAQAFIDLDSDLERTEEVIAYLTSMEVEEVE